MDPGKAASQASHASAQSLISYFKKNPHKIHDFHNLGNSGTRIVLRCKNASQIEKAYQQAQEANLPCAKFVDQGHIMLPHFTGDPVLTGFAIGPCEKHECKHITKKFRCL